MVSQCIVCDAQIKVQNGTQVAEIISCPECKNKLEVKEITHQGIKFAEAPVVEEDWGE